MLNLLKKLFGGRKRHNSNDCSDISPIANNNKDILQPEASFIVTFDDDIIRCLRPDGKEEFITWAKLVAVLIETNDLGPLLADVFWLLLSRDMQSGCVIPQGATGEKELLIEMQKRLTGFDNEKLTTAMLSTNNKRFLIWQRPKLDLTQSTKS